ncbi:GNAT family N-acetyltransferase [Candidatus Palauibacter sp.]|uniref:GNAT family N-acetyltransferase n=1 Tax=Candidatus Palauibacter sp. TaxID=3101350 RepID=UPI003B5986B4
MRVRLAERTDVDRLLELMRGLARFEEYIDDFAVTRESVLEHGFGEGRLFTAFVAEEDDDLVGMAVVYTIPWTYALRPKVVLKELFVEKAARNLGVGKALMAAVVSHARAIDAAELIWTVMEGNREAEGFYRGLGASPDLKWNNWSLNLDD